MSATFDVTRFVDHSRFSSLQRRVLAICLLLGITDGFNSLAVGYAIPSLAEKWSVTPGSFSLVVAAALVGEILASVTLAPLGDRVGRKRIIWIGVVVFSIPSILAAFAPGVTVLAILRFLSGLGIGIASSNLFALGSEYSPARIKTTAVTVIGAGMGAGGAICGLFASVVVPAFGGAALFLLAGAVPLIALLLTIAWLPDSLESYVRRGRTDRIAAIMNRIDGTERCTAADSFTSTAADQLGRIGIVELFRSGRAVTTTLAWSMMFLTIAGAYMVFTFLTTLLVMMGVELAPAILGTSVLTLGGVVGGIALGLLIDRTRWGARALLLAPAVQALATVALLAVLRSGSSTWVVITCAVLGSGMSGATTATIAVIARAYPPRLRATGLGWAAGVSRIGAIISPVAGGVLIDGGIAPATILLLTLVPAAVNVVFILAFARASTGAGHEPPVSEPAAAVTPVPRVTVT